nr:reverse transcriptase domain-containing protein [Tanacetum cinerariifolium]
QNSITWAPDSVSGLRPAVSKLGTRITPWRNQREDNRRWEFRMRINIPEFDGNTLNPEGFIDWLAAIE